ncbi:IS66 family insertion sequence element accessory protein TnpB [Brucella pseudogrignonensis]
MVATKSIDFRKGHDGLAALVSSVLRENQFTGTAFVFRSRRADRLKLLYWDGTGLVMAYKRLEDTSFTWPAVRDGLMTLNHAQFEALFPGSTGIKSRLWKPERQLRQMIKHLDLRVLRGSDSIFGLYRLLPPLIFPPFLPRNARRFWH